MKKFLLITFFLLSGCTFQPVIVSELMGKDKGYVLNKFDDPVIARTEGSNQVWSYRNGDCSYLIFFDKDDVVRWVDAKGSCDTGSASETSSTQ